MSIKCYLYFQTGNISIKDLGNVYEKLYDARTKWFDIGLALNIENGTLESIENGQHDNGECLRRMLAHRIQSGGPLCWNDVCCCLKKPTVGRRDLADEIQQGLFEQQYYNLVENTITTFSL